MQPSNIRISNRCDRCVVEIEGTIGVPEEWQFEDPASRIATYEKFSRAVEQLRAIEAPEVEVNIRSTGGDVNDALLIYDALCSLDCPIITRCYGYTASAATVIAQAASEGRRELSAHALYLIHQSICAAEGNAAELAARIELLEQTDRRLAELYAVRSGRPVEAFEALMAENRGTGRWLSPEEALTAGLVDRIVNPATSTAEEAPSEASETKNGTAPANRWQRLAERLGLRHGTTPQPAWAFGGEALPEDRNIFHFGLDAEKSLAVQRSLIAFEQGQQQCEPTHVKATEDPSVHEILRSANERAYAEDVRRIAER